MKHGKNFPFGLYVLPRDIKFYHMNRYKLSWVILSFAEWWVRSRKVLAIYRFFSFAYSLFVSLKMSGMSITYSGYWYPPSPDNSPHDKTQNLHSEPIHLKWSIQANTPFPKLYHYGVWVIFLKKKTKIHISIQKTFARSSNKKTKDFLCVCPFPPSPLIIISSIRSGFDWVPTTCEPLFGSATQVTKVCYTLPTQNSTYQH